MKAEIIQDINDYPQLTELCFLEYFRDASDTEGKIYRKMTVSKEKGVVIAIELKSFKSCDFPEVTRVIPLEQVQYAQFKENHSGVRNVLRKENKPEIFDPVG